MRTDLGYILFVVVTWIDTWINVLTRLNKLHFKWVPFIMCKLYLTFLTCRMFS